MIAYQNFVRLLTDATKFETFDAYVAECGGSIDNDDLPRTIHTLEIIWAIGHEGVSVASLMAASGMSMRALAMEYGLPYRTAQNWKYADRKPPEWLIPLLAYAVFSDLV